MPPVFGPSSRSKARLKSCADGKRQRRSFRRRARTPRPPALRAAPRSRAAGRAPPPPASAASSSSCVRQTNTPLPAASPSALITQGGRATDKRLRRRHARGAHHVLREALRPFDRRSRAARAEDRDAVLAQRVGNAFDERRLGPDDDEVDGELAREPEQALGVLGAHRMAMAVLRDPGIAGRAVELASSPGSARSSTRARARAHPTRRGALSRGECKSGCGLTCRSKPTQRCTTGLWGDTRRNCRRR